MTGRLLLLLGLGVATVQDVRWKKVWLPLLWGITAVLLAKNFVEGNGVSFILCCAFFIAFFLGAHGLAGGQIGVGDAFIFGMTGAGMGWKDNFMLVYVTFLCAFFAAVFLTVIKKKGIKYEMPLSPFILFAYIVLLV